MSRCLPKIGRHYFDFHPGAVLENGATLEGGAVFFLYSATGGAELRTIKWLQGWSRFGFTFFLSVGYFITFFCFMVKRCTTM